MRKKTQGWLCGFSWSNWMKVALCWDQTDGKTGLGCGVGEINVWIRWCLSSNQLLLLSRHGRHSLMTSKRWMFLGKRYNNPGHSAEDLRKHIPQHHSNGSKREPYLKGLQWETKSPEKNLGTDRARGQQKCWSMRLRSWEILSQPDHGATTAHEKTLHCKW